ncbi:MAG TPA: AMP-binding protein [Acidimicrobiales bacterium]|nr:AMP-binding protein [Acidimicrobiales bacterium]
MPVLVPLVTSPARGFVDGLRRAWERGDAVLPVDHRLPAAAQRDLAVSLGAGEPVEAGDALVMATSGTTALPRGVVLNHAAVEASALATSRRLDVDPGRDTWLSALPLAHVGGLSVIARALVLGVPFTFDWDDPACTLTSLVPTQVQRLSPGALHRFRHVLVGGSADWGAAERPDNVVHTYGMTETGSGVVYDGLPLDGVDVRVDPADSQVWLRGPMLLRAYRHGPAPFDAAGWLPTGDAGWLEEEPGAGAVGGRLHILGRLDDVIVTGAEKVWPDAVERALRAAAGVAEVAVAGRPDAEWGQRVVAFVVPASPAAPPSLDALRDAVKASLPPWCAPKELVLVESLPRTAIGKVIRKSLRTVDDD